MFLLDVVTKFMVTGSMARHQSIPIVGDLVRLTYIRNPGAAFGLHLGDYSRPFFIVVTVLALAFLAWMWIRTPGWDRVRSVALTLLLAGAAGNLQDRVRSAEGVIDFIDVGVGDLRWPVFNVADSAITVGAILLAISLWRQEAIERERAAGEEEGGASQSSHG